MGIKIRRGSKELFQCDLASTFSRRLLGIMFQGTPLRESFRRPLLFVFDSVGSSSNSIHSFFCFVRFDAVYLDCEKRVVDVIPSIPPWVPWTSPKSAAKYLIEMPDGWAKKFNVNAGDRLQFDL